ncbi:ribonucleotide-diphosphate reductase subunit beta [Pseudonocardia alni]|uniref:ribonucleotide-diphosphate reductase subunit beta n=2 Tax=Pseudonocardia alni TaxID=33907 RepID=UPI003407C82B
MSRWTTLLMDEAELSRLPDVPVGDVLEHADLVTRERPGPIDLYRRWERQQWSAEDLVLERDAAMMADPRVPEPMRALLRETVATFIIGEYTGLDMLGPIMVGSPDEEYSLFLGTQVADEARHTRAVFRMGEEVLGLDPDPRRMLAQAWQMSTPAHTELALLEGEVMRGVTRTPDDHEAWLQAVALFHLVTEGVLALVGQRVLVHALREVRLFDGIKAAFTAMCRDESRHVGFGLHALRRGLLDGHADAVHDVLERAVPIALRLDEEFDGIATDFRPMSIDILRRHLAVIGADPVFVSHLLDQHDPRLPQHASLRRTAP